MQRVTLLSVPIDAVTPDEAVARILGMLELPMRSHVMTPNNEMLVQAYGNAAFRSLLSRTALNLPDSTGVVAAARWTKQVLPARVTGVDTVERLCGKLGSSHAVFLLGGAPGVAGNAAAALQEKLPSLTVAGTYAGSPKDDDASAIVELINRSGADVLFVAYGSPAQDLWIDRHFAELSSVRVAMGVGGTFDFLAGTKKRAPSWMRGMGLEWLWRLLQEPLRFPRILRAVIVFPLLILRHGRVHPADLPRN